MKQMPDKPETAVLLARIANDPTYPDYHRCLCAVELCHRFVTNGMTLKEIARVLDHPLWLEQENIHLIKLVTGLCPIKVTAEDSSFSIVVLPEPNRNASGAYLRIQGQLMEGELFQILKYGKAENEIGKRVLREIAISENKP